MRARGVARDMNAVGGELSCRCHKEESGIVSISKFNDGQAMLKKRGKVLL